MFTTIRITGIPFEYRHIHFNKDMFSMPVIFRHTCPGTPIVNGQLVANSGILIILRHVWGGGDVGRLLLQLCR